MFDIFLIFLFIVEVLAVLVSRKVTGVSNKSTEVRSQTHIANRMCKEVVKDNESSLTSDQKD